MWMSLKAMFDPVHAPVTTFGQHKHLPTFCKWLSNYVEIDIHCETNIGLFLPWKREEVKFHYALWGTDLPQVSEGEFTY